MPLRAYREIAKSEAGTNSFTHKSFLDRILSLKRRLRIFLLVSFQLICAALLLGTSYVTKSFQSLSEQLCKSNLDSLISQLDLRTSLSLNQFGSTTCRSQLQQNKFQSEQLVQQQLPANRALATQLQHNQHQNTSLMTTSLMRTRALTAISFKETSSRQRSRTSSFRNNQFQTANFDNFIFTSFMITDQPFKGTKQLSKKPCFTSCPFQTDDQQLLKAGA